MSHKLPTRARSEGAEVSRYEPPHEASGEEVWQLRKTGVRLWTSARMVGREWIEESLRTPDVRLARQRRDARLRELERTWDLIRRCRQS